MTRVNSIDSFDHVVEIDLDLDLDIDNSNLDLHNSDNSTQNSSQYEESPPHTLSELLNVSENGYQVKENDFSSDNSDIDFYEIETDSDEDELLTYALPNFKKTIFQNDMAGTPVDVQS